MRCMFAQCNTTEFGVTCPDVWEQMWAASGSSLTLLRYCCWSAGADPTQAFGPLTQKAEMANGRAAMLGIAGLLIIELTKGSALF